MPAMAVIDQSRSVSDAILMGFRKIIQSEMKKRGWTTYELWKAVENDVNKQTVYNFLSNETSIRLNHLEAICEALGLTLAKGGRPKKKAGGK